MSLELDCIGPSSSVLLPASRRRILIKRSSVLDTLTTCSTVGLDKTGTLTTGCLTCTSIIPQPDYDHCANASASLKIETDRQYRALGCAASLSQWSPHPVSRAVVSVGNAFSWHLPRVDVEDFQLVPGAGVKGLLRVNGGDLQQAVFGSVDFASEVLPDAKFAEVKEVVSLVENGKISAVLVEGKGAEARWSMFCFEDGLQVHSANAVRELQEGSWRGGNPNGRFAQRVVMLTGEAFDLGMGHHPPSHKMGE